MQVNPDMPLLQTLRYNNSLQHFVPIGIKHNYRWLLLKYGSGFTLKDVVLPTGGLCDCI